MTEGGGDRAGVTARVDGTSAVGPRGAASGGGVASDGEDGDGVHVVGKGVPGGQPEAFGVVDEDGRARGAERGLPDGGGRVDGARAVGAGVLVRNAGKEQQVEFTMAVTNRVISGLPTVLVPPDPNTATISSTFVRELVRRRRYDDIAPLVPQPVHLALTGL